MKTILLTFDIEEFDKLKKEDKDNKYRYNEFSISYNGLKEILKLLNKYKIKSTFFITASFVQKYPKLIKNISKKHEIALHGLLHKDNYNLLKPIKSYKKLKRAKQIIEKTINKKIYGFRAPRCKPPSYKILNRLDLKYDSSINPIFLPHYYNNILKKRKIHKKNNLIIIPLSATPLLRLPLFWIVFRNLGLNYAKLCTKLCLLDQNYIVLLFHPWEFINLNKLNLPFLIKRNTGKKLINLLEAYIKWCLKKNFKFNTITNYLKNV